MESIPDNLKNDLEEINQQIISHTEGKKRLEWKFIDTLEYIKVNYHALPIFKTRFGNIMEEFINMYCSDTSIIDDNIEINTKKINKVIYKNLNNKTDYLYNHENMTKDYIKFKEQYMIVKGMLQSGKTKFMIATSAKHLMFKKTAIILLRNITNDLIQTKHRIEKFRDDFKKYATDCGITNHLINIEIFYKLTNNNDIIKMLKADPPAITLLIANHHNIKKITDNIENMDKNLLNYTLFIDEVDEVDSTTADITKPFINILKINAQQVVGVSATVLGVYSEWNIKPHCVRELAIPENYTGIRDLETVQVDTGNNQIKIDENIEQIFKTVPCLKNMLEKIANYKRNTVRDNNQAMVYLVSITRLKNPQKNIFNYMIEKYPEVANILMTDDGIDVYHPSLGVESIKLGDTKSKVNKDHKYVHNFSNKVDIGRVLGLLEKQGIEKIKNVLVIAGDKANRAITFSSSGLIYKNKEEEIRRWHVNRMLLKFPDDIPQNEAIQRVGRLCGIFAPNTLQRVYANKTDIETIKKAYGTQEDILEQTVRKYGRMTKVNKPINASNSKTIEVNIWKAIEDIKPEENIGGHDLLNNTKISKWKLQVSGYTPTGRNKFIKRMITNRNSVNPCVVVDDMRHTEEDFELNKPTKVIHSDVIVSNSYDKSEENMSEIITVLQACKYILSNGCKMSSNDIFNILKNNKNFEKYVGLRNQISHCLGHNKCFKKNGSNPIKYSMS